MVPTTALLRLMIWCVLQADVHEEPRVKSHYSCLLLSLLVGLGLDELSMSAPAIPPAKQIIRGLDSADARRRAQAALELETAEAVRRMMNAER